MTTDLQPMIRFILDEWEKDVPESVMAAAQAIADQYRGQCAGIIFYGSCLRTGEIIDKVLDFYVLVDSYRAAYGSWPMAAANKMLPPNVFYHEMEFGDITLRSKYAVLSVKDYGFRVSENCLNVSVWARFCQPAKLLLARDDAVREKFAADTVTAVLTMLRSAQPLAPKPLDSEGLWVVLAGSAGPWRRYAFDPRARRPE